MTLVEAPTAVEIDYAENIIYEAGRMTRNIKTLRVPSASENFDISTFDSKEEIYDIDISRVCAVEKGALFLETNYHINKYRKY